MHAAPAACRRRAGIPDGTDQLVSLGLIPYSDALEDIDETQVPGLSAAFGVGKIAVPRAGTLPKGSAAAATAAAAGRKAGSDIGSDSGSEVVALGAAAGVSPPELVEATLRKGSDVVGQSIRGAAFRARFHAAGALADRGLPAVSCLLLCAGTGC